MKIIGMRTKRFSKKAVILTLSIVMVFGMMIGGTLAHLSTKTNKVNNTFISGKVATDITEEFEETKKTKALIQNTGNTDAYIRAAVVGNTVDEDGYITGAADVSAALAGTGWKKIGDYYYWTAKVPTMGFTDNLLSSTIDLTGKKVTIISEGIQAEPADAIKEAWGIDPATWTALTN